MKTFWWVRREYWFQPTANDTQGSALYLLCLFELGNLVHDKCWFLTGKVGEKVAVSLRRLTSWELVPWATRVLQTEEYIRVRREKKMELTRAIQVQWSREVSSGQNNFSSLHRTVGETHLSTYWRGMSILASWSAPAHLSCSLCRGPWTEGSKSSHLIKRKKRKVRKTKEQCKTSVETYKGGKEDHRCE